MLHRKVCLQGVRLQCAGQDRRVGGKVRRSRRMLRFVLTCTTSQPFLPPLPLYLSISIQLSLALSLPPSIRLFASLRHRAGAGVSDHAK